MQRTRRRIQNKALPKKRLGMLGLTIPPNGAFIPRTIGKNLGRTPMIPFHITMNCATEWQRYHSKKSMSCHTSYLLLHLIGTPRLHFAQTCTIQICLKRTSPRSEPTAFHCRFAWGDIMYSNKWCAIPHVLRQPGCPRDQSQLTSHLNHQLLWSPPTSPLEERCNTIQAPPTVLVKKQFVINLCS